MTWEREVIGDCALYRGDCREIVPTLGSVDACVVDPPYGTEDLGQGYGRRQNWDVGDRKGRVILHDTDLSVLTAVWPSLLKIIHNGWLAVFYAPRRTPHFVQATAGADWFGSIVWDKKAMGLGYHIRYEHESIALFRVGHPPRPPEALHSILTAYHDDTRHPHAKPVALLLELVRWCCPPGGTVLDPCMGIGSTAVAALRLGRAFIGCELDRRYWDIACQRVSDTLRQGHLFVPGSLPPRQPSLFGQEIAP